MVDIGPIYLLFSLFLTSLVYGHLHTSSVSYLEAVHYDKESLHHQHRTKRSTGELVHLQFEAFSRGWSVKLKRDGGVFHNNIVIENSKGPVTYDFDSTYTGKIDDKGLTRYYAQSINDWYSLCTDKIDGILHTQGSLTVRICYAQSINDLYSPYTGKIDGRLTILSRFYAQSVNEWYYPYTGKIDDQDIHTVIYNVKDVNIPKESHVCGLKGQNTQLKPELNENINTHDGMDTNFKLRYTSGLIDKHRRYRRTVDPNKKICELYIQVDHTLFFRYNNVTDDVIANINNHVMAVNSIFNDVDFYSDSSPDSIGFSIKRIKIYDDPTVPGYKYAGNHGVNSMLHLHSEENYDQFCLSYIFTYRDFDNGILGLAWTAEPGTSGGLCSRYTRGNKSFQAFVEYSGGILHGSLREKIVAVDDRLLPCLSQKGQLGTSHRNLQLHMSLVNINTYSFQELLQLPGIGIKTGEQIMDIRDGKGFVTEADLATISHLRVTMALIARLDFSTNGGGQNIGPPPEARRKHQSMMNTIIDGGMVASPGMPCQTHGQLYLSKKDGTRGKVLGLGEDSAFLEYSSYHEEARSRPETPANWSGVYGEQLPQKEWGHHNAGDPNQGNNPHPGGSSSIGYKPYWPGEDSAWEKSAPPKGGTPSYSRGHPMVHASNYTSQGSSPGTQPANTGDGQYETPHSRYGKWQDNRGEDTSRPQPTPMEISPHNMDEDTRQTPARSYGEARQ
ncbi:ADAM10 [Mytilus coruscus]|uniref:ADAM10 n=1 Tax=Mytilus coruscus TaxID=42192 RepID=A0A6J8CKR9_MYTCO|nr:ADAM10 [Mytilus coruscus]